MGESWFEQLIRCNSQFPEVDKEKMDLPTSDKQNPEVDVDMDAILKTNSPQTSLDELIQRKNTELTEEEAAAILEKHTASQSTIDQLIQQQNQAKEQPMVITPYMRTSGYQNLRVYWYQLPILIPQIVMQGGENGGELNFQGVGEPDENLLEQFELTVQKYLDYYFSEIGLEAHIKKPVYQENGGIYKKIGDYRLSIQKHEKIK